MNSMPSGARYSAAHLSKLDLPMSHMDQLSKWAHDPQNLLVIIGNPGVGKTYFCAALSNMFAESKSHRSIYMTERDFFSHIRCKIGDTGYDYSYEVEKMAAYQSSPGKPVIWMLDDIGSSQMTDWQKEVLHTFVDSLYTHKTPAILTSNIWLRDMSETFSGRFKSRLCAKENCIIEMIGQDKRELGL